jgi:predicted O-methyltransferase YrrM
VPPLTFGQRIRAIRKLLTRADPYILIARKPPDMVAERPPSHVFEALGAAIERQAKESALARRVLDDDDLAARARAAADAHRNDYLSPADAAVLYGVVAALAPKRIVEVGSGYSTRIMRQAAKDAGGSCEITAIDPAPRAEIAPVADRVIRANVVGIEEAPFRALAAGDILFIDGSHYAFNGTDAPFLLLEILPILAPGVVVHVHDIFLPYEYDVLFSSRSYNEQYVLAGLLLGGGMLRVEIPVQALHRAGRLGAGTSFWMTKL